MASLADVSDAQIKSAALIQVYDPSIPPNDSNPLTVYRENLALTVFDNEITSTTKLLAIVLKPGESTQVSEFRERVRRLKNPVAE
jgi:hypothetical protein